MTTPTVSPDFGPELEAMRQGTDYRIKVSVRKFSTYLRPLTITETVQVTGLVQDKIAELPQAQQHGIAERTIYAKETLKVASTSEPGAQDASLTDYVLDRMTPDEVQHLFKQYVAVCDKVNPSLEFLPADQLKSMVEDIKKKGSSALIGLSFSEAISLLNYLVPFDG